MTIRTIAARALVTAGLAGLAIFGQDEPKKEGKQKGSTITGCLTKGDTAGTYVITDEKSGATTTVTGNPELEKHSNHRVKLTVAKESPASTTATVTKIQHLAATCTPSAPK